MGLGTRIVIALVFFMSFISYLAYRSFQENTDLVAENYYEKEVNFQNVIDGRNNTNKLRGKVSWQKTASHFVVEFPQEMEGVELTGTVEFMCPSDKNKDVNQKFSIKNNKIKINLSDFNTGPYRMSLSWKTVTEHYYYEELIVF